MNNFTWFLIWFPVILLPVGALSFFFESTWLPVLFGVFVGWVLGRGVLMADTIPPEDDHEIVELNEVQHWEHD